MDLNIRDRRGEGAVEALLFVFIATVAGIVIFGLFPGIFLTSILNYFINMTIGQLWGSSILLSFLVYGVINYYFKDSGSPCKIYLGSAAFCGLFLLLFTLFLNYNFAARTVMRMFDSATEIPYEYLTAPSELDKGILGTYQGISINDKQNNLNTYLMLSDFDGKNIKGSVGWMLDDGYKINILNGIISDNKFEFYSIPDKRNAEFKSKIYGVIQNGEIHCEYKLEYKNKEVVEGSFNGYNLK